MINKTPDSRKLELIKKVHPNFVYNRFDIRYGDNFDLYEIKEENDNIVYVPIHIEENVAKLGVWLTNIKKKNFGLLKKRIFSDYKSIDTIEAQHSLNKIRKKSKQNIHWHINLNRTIEDFNSNLSKKTRYNTKWYPKKLIEDFKEYDIQHYAVSEIPSIVVEEYFKFKSQTHENEYSINAKEYLKKYYVTDGYVLYLKDEISAIAFLNITDKNVYLENITYNQKFKQYSPGMVLYYFIIKDLISKNCNVMFLSSGTSEYKQRFNGIATSTYSGKVMRKSAYIKKITKKFFNL